MDPNGCYSNYYSQFAEQSSETYPSTSTTQCNRYQNELNIFLNEIWPNENQEGTCTNADSIPLPEELTKLFKPSECKLCGVEVRTEAIAFTHYEGKAHIKNVNAFMRQHYSIYGSLKIRKERFAPVVCEVCNIELTSNIVYQQHINGKQHFKNIRKTQFTMENLKTEEEESLPPPPPPPSLSNYICVICNVRTNTEMQMFNHQTGQKHRKRLNKMEQLHLDSALDEFYNGEWPQVSNTHNKHENSDTVGKDFVVDPNMDFPLEFNRLPAEKYDNSQLIETQIEAENKKQISQISEDCVQFAHVDKQEEQFTQIHDESFLSQLEDENKKQLTQITTDSNLSLMSKAEYERSDGFDNKKINSPEVQNKVEEIDIAIQHFVPQTDEMSVDVNEANSDKCNENKKNGYNTVRSSLNCEVENDNVEKKLRNETQSTEKSKINQENNKVNDETTDQQELTKLAIEEIVRESNAFNRQRNIGTSDSCTYDVAGFRMKKIDRDNKSDVKLSNRRPYLLHNKNGNNKYDYPRHYNFRKRNLNLDRKWMYGYNYNRNRYQYRYSNNQEYRYNKRYQNSRTYDRNYNIDYNKKRKRSTSRNYSNESNRSRNSGRHYKKSYVLFKSKDKRKKCRNYSSNDTCSSHSRRCSSRGCDSCCASSRRCSTSGSSTSSKSSTDSSDNGDYRLDKDGYCEKKHRSELAYSTCSNYHRKPYNQSNK